MKKYLIILALMASMPLFAEHVDPETARKVATSFLNNNGAKTDQLTDLSKSAGFSNLYIFSTKESFVIVSSDDCFQPILGYSTENPFYAETIPANLRWLLEGYDERIAEIRQSKEPTREDIQHEWRGLISGKYSLKTKNTSDSVDPLISTLWHQEPPFNNLCPENTVTGCVATAMAQVMKKWNYPETGISSHSYVFDAVTHSADFGSTTYDWGNMINSYADGYDETQATAVATLMRHCGVSVEMKYVPGGESGSTINRACAALKTYFNYTGTYRKKSSFPDDSSWINRVKEDLDQGMPLLYGGYYPNKPGGHAFVCDGYNVINDTVFLHFNWGWGAGHNGYYSVNKHSFSREQDAVFNIKPVKCDAEKPSSLTCSQLDGHKVSLSWSSGSNAVSYNIYRNNTLVAKTDVVSFMDTEAVPGDNVYYIRSVDNNGNLSLASNSITVNISFQTPAVENLCAFYTNDNPKLSWSTPWWHPQTSTGTITYVEETRPELDYFIGWDDEEPFMLYWGSQYPTELLTSHQGQAIYKATFYSFAPGNYKVLVYQGTDTENNYPQELKAVQSINTAHIGWIEIPLDEPVFIDSSKDLWVFIYDADGKMKQFPCLKIATENNHQYYGFDYGDMQRPPHEACAKIALEDFPINWLIRTYLTDGTYSYNLYDNDIPVNENPISETSYTISGLTNDLHQFTVKTYFNNEESGTSNTANITVGDVALTSLSLQSDNLTVAPNSTLTISGTIYNDNPANLVIEDGGQLIHPNNAVNATLKKSIVGYVNDGSTEKPADGWYTIASPVNGAITEDFLSGEYDFYSYDEEHSLWINQKAHIDDFPIFNRGKGFLYANQESKTLQYAGSMIGTDTEVEVALEWNSTNENLKGFNLVGNPFSRNLNKGDICFNDTLLTVYYAVEGGSNLVAQRIDSRAIKPGQGFFVQASGKNQQLTFNPASKGLRTDSKPSFICIKAGDNNFIDYAFVQMDNSNMLRKTVLDNVTPKVYIINQGKTYAALNVNENQGDIPIGFEAIENGRYTTTIEAFGLDANYLHLIDNITGDDIDLLQNPTYTFEAKVDDYPSRFRLLFEGKDVNDPSDNNIDFTDGDLQILDVTGRVVATDRNTKLIPGVYILRTVKGNEIKTEKIIIK